MKAIPTRGRRRGAWRPWLFPLIAMGLALAVWDFGFDPEGVRDDLGSRQLDAALLTLEQARPGELLPELAAVAWWPQASRKAQLDALAAEDDGERFEDPRLPTFVAPLDGMRSAPAVVELREPTTRPYSFELVNIELQLPAMQRVLPAGTQRIDLDLTLIPGTSYQLSLGSPEGDALVAFAGFRLLGAAEAREVGITMATALELAPDEPSGELLVSLVALSAGLTDEALRRLAALADEPGYGRLVTELRAIALAEQGLDRTALALLDAP